MLEIKNLSAKVEDKVILKDVELKIGAGEIHAIMGPNGAGKSTLAKVLAGHPAYEVVSGEVWFKGQDLLDLDVDERAHAGFFMSFQYPVEIPGVSNEQFLRVSLNSRLKANGEEELSEDAFREYLEGKMKDMEIRPEFKDRAINEGFSGGEKKRNEILQLAVLDPDMAVLDETDSGLDIDAMRVVARGVNRVMDKKKGLLLITHYQRLLDYIKPDFVHVMMDGRIVETGGPELALKLEEEGYDWLMDREAKGAVEC